MGLLKGTWTFSRYGVLGKLPEQFHNTVDEGLKKYAFANQADRQREKSLGWTSLENILDTDFTYAQYKLADYLIFSLRIDRRSVPLSLLKLKALEAEKKYLAETGKKRLYRQEQEEIKEKIRLGLMEKALPIPAFYEICWSPSRNMVFFGSHSDKIIEDFQKLFKETFHVSLHPFLPWERGGADREKIAPSLPESGPPAGPSLPDGGTTAVPPLFPGREFLTWLWYKSEERNGTITVPEMGENEILFLQRLVLAAGEREYSETVICQGLHSDMKEGKEALRHGKKIKEARLHLIKDGTKWEFTFKADTFQFQSLKLPTVMDLEDETDREGRNLERIFLMEKAVETMDKLFASYLQLRNSGQWESAELPRMEKWLSQ